MSSTKIIRVVTGYFRSLAALTPMKAYGRQRPSSLCYEGNTFPSAGR